MGLLFAYSKHPNYRILTRIVPEKRPNKVKPVSRRINRRLPSQNLAQLVTDYRAGASTRELAAIYGISKTSATKLLTDYGVMLRHQGRHTR